MDQDSSFSDEIQKKLEALPPDIRSFIYSADMSSVVQQIGQKHQLHVDQMGALEAEAAAAMIGVTEREEFVENLAEALNIDTQRSTLIAKDVNDLLFIKIRESMKNASPASSLTPRPQVSAPAPVTVATTPSPTPTQQEVPPPPTILTAPAPKPQVTLAPHPHDLMLVEKTVTTPSTAPTTAPAVPAAPENAAPIPPKPNTYNTDPYREPVEP